MISYISRVAALQCLAWGYYYRSNGRFFHGMGGAFIISQFFFFCSGAGSFLLNYTLTYNIWTTLRVACESMGIYACWLYLPFACASLLCHLMVPGDNTAAPRLDIRCQLQAAWAEHEASRVRGLRAPSTGPPTHGYPTSRPDEGVPCRERALPGFPYDWFFRGSSGTLTSSKSS